jgi:DNA-directed RNA polymerase subunit RPC12/RpoP
VYQVEKEEGKKGGKQMTDDIFYKIMVECTNCGATYEAEIIKGKLVYSEDCEKCGNKSLVRRKQANEY